MLSILSLLHIKNKEMKDSRKQQLLSLQSQRDSLRANTTMLAKTEQWEELEGKLKTLSNLDSLWNRLTSDTTLSKAGRLA